MRGREERKWPSEGTRRGDAVQALLVITGLVFWSAARIQLALPTAVHILGTSWSLTVKGNSRSSGAPDPVFLSYPERPVPPAPQRQAEHTAGLFL